MSETKHILMIGGQMPTEALRMASGLTLLDDQVQVAILGGLEDNAANAEQLEALEFAEVPIQELARNESVESLAELLIKADVVFSV